VTASDSRLVFSTSTGLEITDGSATDTALLLADGSSSGTVLPIMAAIGESVLFVTGQTYVERGGALSGFTQLWRTDGTATGTSLVVALPDRSAAANYTGDAAGIFQMATIGGRALFTYSDGDSNSQIWSTDGTPAGTFSLPIGSIYAIDGTAPISDGVILLTGSNFYVTDGTVAGTQAIPASVPSGYGAGDLVPFASGGAFLAYNSLGDWQIWTTNGTAAGTRMLLDLPSTLASGDGPGKLTALGDKLLFSYGSQDTGIATLWVTDGTASGTRSLGVPGSLYGGLVVAGRYFTSSSEGIAVTDGTLAGTSMVFVSSGSGYPSERTFPDGGMAQLDNGVIFDVSAQNSYQLYFTDGTQSGTRLITTLPPGANSDSFGDFASLGNSVVFNYGNNAWITDGTAAGTTVLQAGVTESTSGFVPEETTVTAVLTPVPCLAEGTRLLTNHGHIPVELLSIGDVVLTVSGGEQAIQWIGRRRVDCRRHPDPERVQPIRIAPHAFGQGRPQRAVLLSPDHSVFMEDVLIPIKFLSNGNTIARIEMDAITYYHIELPHHDVVLAESLPVESYLETGGRSAFENTGEPLQLHPDFEPDPLQVAMVWQNCGYAPLLGQSGELDRVRSMLAVQATLLRNAPGKPKNRRRLTANATRYRRTTRLEHDIRHRRSRR
jgi:ELWxxDGT repeat protein